MAASGTREQRLAPRELISLACWVTERDGGFSEGSCADRSTPPPISVSAPLRGVVEDGEPGTGQLDDLVDGKAAGGQQLVVLGEGTLPGIGEVPKHEMPPLRRTRPYRA